MLIRLAKLKVFDAGSQETTNFSADVIVNGRNVGTAFNAGDGSATRLTMSQSDREALANYCLALPAHEYEPGKTLPMDTEYYLFCLVDETALAADSVKRMRTKTLFRLRSRPDAVLSISIPFSPDVAARLRKEYKDDLETIHNESPTERYTSYFRQLAAVPEPVAVPEPAKPAKRSSRGKPKGAKGQEKQEVPQVARPGQ